MFLIPHGLNACSRYEKKKQPQKQKRPLKISKGRSGFCQVPPRSLNVWWFSSLWLLFSLGQCLFVVHWSDLSVSTVTQLTRGLVGVGRSTELVHFYLFLNQRGSWWKLPASLCESPGSFLCTLLQTTLLHRYCTQGLVVTGLGRDIKRR